MASLSPKKQSAIEKLRESVRDVWRPEFGKDAYLLRWLKARNFDVKKAERMLRAHLDWRRQYGADDILDDPQLPEVILRFYPGGFFGRSKEGQPLWIDPSGYCDMKGLVKSASFYDLIRSRIYILELVHRDLLPRVSAELGRPVETTAVIFDLDRFGARHMWRPGLDTFIEVTKMCEANYPETMGRCFIINAPALFPALYQLVKPFLHEETLKKIQVLGSNYKEVLLKYFDKEQLPVRYGGTLRDANGDGDCRAHVCYGGTVPRSLYLTCDRSSMKEMTVARGGVLKIEKQIVTPGCLLTWTFSTEDHDISFGLSLAAPGGGAVVLRENRRTISHIVPERGGHRCERAGCYILRFDNSYSWTRPKRLWLSVECLSEAERRRKLHDDVELMVAAENGDSGSVESFYSAHSHMSEH